LAIGAELNTESLAKTNGPFEGYVAEVRLYNRALPSDEVSMLATGLLAGRQRNVCSS